VAPLPLSADKRRALSGDVSCAARRQVACDVCVNNLLPLANSKLLRDYSSVDPRLAQLVYVVKHWARQRDVNNTYRGTLRCAIARAGAAREAFVPTKRRSCALRNAQDAPSVRS
jgi:hypothetical protein